MTQAPQPFLDSASPRAGVPAPLRVAAALTRVEAVVLLGLAVFEAWSFDSSRVAMGVTTTVFFAVFAAVLTLAARGLLRRAGTARSLVVFAQLIALGVAWSFRGGNTTWVSVLVVLVAVPILIGIFHPASIRAIDGRDSQS